MRISDVRWAWVGLGFLAVNVVLFGLAYGWVAVYAYGIEPGHDAAFYEAYAQGSSPIIGILASLPACYAVARWIRRSVDASHVLATVAAAGVLVVAVDVGSVLAIGTASDLWMCALAVPLKIAGGALVLRGVRASQPVVAA